MTHFDLKVGLREDEKKELSAGKSRLHKRIRKFSQAILFLLIPMICHAEAQFAGSVEPVSQEIQEQMQGYTWNADCPVDFDDLAYLKLSYWGFDNEVHMGELIVHKIVATEVLGIFEQLFVDHFPIERMELPEKLFKNKKFASPVEMLIYMMEFNNTYSFFCRKDTQTTANWSLHAFGLAIDINPIYNPCKCLGKILPQKGEKFMNRKLNQTGMIKENDPIVRTFANQGWKWGGYFSEGEDYMHFQKALDSYCKATRIEYLPPSLRIHKLP